ncbi:MAG: hypothetical protein LBU96_07490 [Yokenella regensburgei]|jgi:hypothetical protein|uniref:Uncharacterized protein n=1 Tax=Yokenella regensburgei TaxID=158877 RepID=A0AB38G195_9ENTR|nr:hypothetical protein [Yokenella regensburgei]EHM49305.1 hypothetical protein HMPREF0880_01870 [Yokenella regensburgei ATCC 43003]KAF1370132.1 hypothetical protein FHR25_001061 [Yokenella regensburgei]KFD23216.1 hypothetical protein GYRE_02463 [Yokenella regensburgei ATCC 49455]MDQ4430544.1 hypothetical protein [Yokenella regensburgei]MDR2216864.1 hypothetical protein [Yokenella regensburgei]
MAILGHFFIGLPVFFFEGAQIDEKGMEIFPATVLTLATECAFLFCIFPRFSV